jgi:hypothetical protein
MPKLRPIVTHADFERMRMFTRTLSVWQQGELINPGIIIKTHDETTVTSTADEQYIKSACQFFYGSHL